MASVRNVIQITTHDSGRHFGCYGHRTLHTPNIDGLAADGVQLTNYFATVPICSASRATMLTGRYPQSHGQMDLPCFGWAMNEDERHITHILRDAGYRNLLFGLQHEVANSEQLAFDDVRLHRDPCDRIASEVGRFLLGEASSTKPFYLQIGLFETHTPFTFGGAEADDSKGVEVPPYLIDNAASRDTMAQFQGAIRKVDDAVGVILDALARSGLEDDTLVIFTTDHGIEMPRAKWFLYDPGIEIALVARCPADGVGGGRKCNLLLSNIDYLPTILTLLEIDVPIRVQGHSFADALRGQSDAEVRDAVFAMYHKTHTRCARTRQHKLIRHFDTAFDYHVPVRLEDVLMKRAVNPVELFDLERDPVETENLAHRLGVREVQERLDRMLWEWMESVNDPLLAGPVRSPSYDAAMCDYTQWKSGTGRDDSSCRKD
jgi:N-sulfoglucosamine sulfohydrolase